jgi:hypothetical protein
MEIEMALTIELLEFVNVKVTGLSELSLPTAVLAKVWLTGVSVTPPGDNPVPESEDDTVAPPRVSGCGYV